MAYNLPNAWDPGFVLPQNVKDEGLQRRALVTKQLPRGTYDNPSVGTGGMAVPQYIRDEGYGQGTFTTKWQPSGSYAGPRVPNWLNQRPKVVKSRPLPGGGQVMTVQSLGDDDAPMPAPFETYGTRAAQALLSRVAVLPPGQRQAALKIIMNQVDKSLWQRTQDITRRYIAQGATVTQAFPQALARALSTGIAAEIIDTGLRRTAPQARSLLGLGCYGPSALGAIELGAETTSSGGSSPSTTPAASTPVATPTVSPTTSPLALSCAPPAGFKWVVDDPTTGAGHWARLKAGEAPGMAPCGSGTVEVRAHPDAPTTLTMAGFQFDPATLTRTWAPSGSGTNVANIKAPPDVLVTDPAALSPDAVSVLQSYLLAAPGDPTAISFNNSKYGFTDARGFTDADAWFAKLGMTWSTPLQRNSIVGLMTNNYPVAKLKRPDTGENMLLNIKLSPVNGGTWSKSNPLALRVYLSKVPDPGIFGAIWDSLRDLGVGAANLLVAPVAQPVVSTAGTVASATGGVIAGGAGAIASAVGDGLNKLGGLACDLLSTPGIATAAGAVGGTVAGMPPQAGAAAGTAGSQIAKASCGGPPPPPPPVAHGSLLPLAIIGGVAVVGALLLFGGSRKSATAPQE